MIGPKSRSNALGRFSLFEFLLYLLSQPTCRGEIGTLVSQSVQPGGWIHLQFLLGLLAVLSVLLLALLHDHIFIREKSAIKVVAIIS